MTPFRDLIPIGLAQFTDLLWLKVPYTLFMAAFIPVWLAHHGPTNFLWFSDVALILGLVGLYLESSLLVSMMALAVVLPELGWNLDFFAHLITGHDLTGQSDYMFDPNRPVYVRGMSLFHVVLPPMLVYLVYRFGYHPLALPAQTALAAVVLLLTYLLTDPQRNINWAFGPLGQPQQTLAPPLYLTLLMLFFPIVVYLPTHLALKYLFGR